MWTRGFSPGLMTGGPLKHARARYGPPAHLHLADDVLLRHHAPMAAVRAVVAMVAEHEVVTFRHQLRPVVVMIAELWGNVVVTQRHVVHVHAAVHDPHDVVLFGNDALDER